VQFGRFFSVLIHQEAQSIGVSIFQGDMLCKSFRALVDNGNCFAWSTGFAAQSLDRNLLRLLLPMSV
jgi:hypothetical protein